MPDAIIPGKDAWKTMTKGEIRGDIQWYEDEPVLCLSPIRPKLRGGVALIAESAIPRYVAAHGKGDRYILAAAARFAEHMGFEPSGFIVSNVADCIYSWLPDLVECPPKPEILKRVRDEAMVSINGKEDLRQRII